VLRGTVLAWSSLCWGVARTEMPSGKTENTRHDGEQDLLSSISRRILDCYRLGTHVELGIPLGSLLEGVPSGGVVNVGRSRGIEAGASGAEVEWAGGPEGCAADD
jgi:hypothetical protein